MSDEQKFTQRLDLNDPEMLDTLREQKNRKLGPARLGKIREVLLLVETGLRRIELRNDVSYLLGRFSKSKPGSNHIDLDPFGARDKGVSRIHAQIHMANNRLYITDMESTNGTYVDGTQIAPNQQHQLRQGSNLILGRMNIQIMYKSATDTSENEQV